MAIRDETRDQLAESVDEERYRPPRYDPFRRVEFPRSDVDWERIRALRGEVDTLTVDVIEWALEAAIEEAEAAVERTARSTIIREQHDFRASFNTIDCNSVTRVSWAATADPIRVHFDLGDIQERDVFLYNDVHESCATIGHLPDYCAVVPIFADARLIGFSQVFGHCNDVGGRVAGSWPITATSTFEEGLLCPPIRLYSRGVLNEDAYKIILRNSRFPEDLRGDIDAFVGAAKIVERRVHDLCSRYGSDVVEAAFYVIMERCEEIVREEALPLIPDGEFVGEDFVENDGLELDTPVKIKVTVRKDCDKLVVDFDGTAPQTRGPVNWPMDGRHYSKWLGGFVKAQVPGMIVNEGMTRVFRCYVPPQTVLSAEFPAPSSDRMMCMFRMIGAYVIAMTKAFGGQMVGDLQGVSIYGLNGVDDSGTPFLYREIFGCGSGARWYADGTDAVDMVPNSRNLPAEFIEQRYPVIVERVGLYPDSGGAGEHRGGFGYVKDIRALVDADLQIVADRTVFAPFGVNGGRAGKPGGAWINPDSETAQRIVFRHEAIPVKRGDLVRIITAGGGGWGDPLERDPEAVRTDVARRLVTRESAEADYGVTLQTTSDPERRFEVDADSTVALRDHQRSNRAPLMLINRGEHAERLIREGRIAVDDFELEACLGQPGHD